MSASEDDRLLIKRYLDGDPAALRTLDAWLGVVLGEDFRSLREEWDDLRQEIRTRLVRNFHLGAFNGHSTLRTYVHRISRNVAIDFSRRTYRRREVRVDLGDSHSPAGRSDMGRMLAKDLLDKILARLSEDDRSLLRLVFELHYSYQEVARELGIPEGTVKSRMSRCKDHILKLRRELAPGE